MYVQRHLLPAAYVLEVYVYGNRWSQAWRHGGIDSAHASDISKCGMKMTPLVYPFSDRVIKSCYE